MAEESKKAVKCCRNGVIEVTITETELKIEESCGC